MFHLPSVSVSSVAVELVFGPFLLTEFARIQWGRKQFSLPSDKACKLDKWWETMMLISPCGHESRPKYNQPLCKAFNDLLVFKLIMQNAETGSGLHSKSTLLKEIW